MENDFIYKHEEGKIEIIDAEKIEGCECFDVKEEEVADIRKLGEEMIKLCVEKGGLGLSAPQVGVFKKMFVWMNAQNSFQIVMNPKFFPDKKTTNVVEGCLSYPGKQFYTKRYKTGNGSYDGLNPNEKTVIKRYFVKLSGERALIWQHEIDHLYGKTPNTIGEIVSWDEK